MQPRYWLIVELVLLVLVAASLVKGQQEGALILAVASFFAILGLISRAMMERRVESVCGIITATLGLVGMMFVFPTIPNFLLGGAGN